MRNFHFSHVITTLIKLRIWVGHVVSTEETSNAYQICITKLLGKIILGQTYVYAHIERKTLKWIFR
jgi:hypothetical protein